MKTRGTWRIKRPALAVAIGLLLALALPQPQVVADVPAGQFVFDGPVTSIAHDDDGNTYVGGLFTQALTPTGGGFLMPIGDGGPPPSFTFPQVVGEVRTAMSDQAGGWYIGGDFKVVGGQPRHGLAHILANGSVDPTWNPNPQFSESILPGGAGGIDALALSGSTLYVGGQFGAIGSEARSGLAAVNTSTGQATSWNPSPQIESMFATSKVMALALSGSTLYVGGSFTKIASVDRHGLAAFDTATGQITSWDAEADWDSAAGFHLPGVHTVLVDGSTVYVGGRFNEIGGAARSNLAALNATTGEATSWAPNPNFSIFSLAKSGSTVYVGGGYPQGSDLPSIGGQTRIGLAAVDATTGEATSWNPQLAAEGIGGGLKVSALVASGSTLYVGGDFTHLGGQPRTGLAALNTATAQATLWNPNPGFAQPHNVRTLALDGALLYVGGGFIGSGPPLATNDGVAKINPDGSLDTDWIPPIVVSYCCGGVSAVAVSGSTVYVGGSFSAGPYSHLIALDAATGQPLAVQPGGNTVSAFQVRSLVATPSTLYVGADSVFELGNKVRNTLAAFDATTGELTPWEPESNSFAAVDAMVLSGSTLYVGGSFFSMGGQERNGLAALDTTTGLAQPWNPNPSGFASPGIGSLALSGSTLYVGGQFTNIGGSSNFCFAAVSTVSGASLGWNPEPSGGSCSPSALVVDGSTVYLGGSFGQIKGEPRRNLAAIDATTASVLPWNPGSPSNSVRALDVYGSTVSAGGAFNFVGTQITGPFVQFNVSGTPGPHMLTVTRTGAGGGTVVSTPSGVSCGELCAHSFSGGTTVQLTATPSPGSSFAGWSGACSGTGVCNVSMAADQNVIARFDQVSSGSDNPSQPPVATPLALPPASGPLPKATNNKKAVQNKKKAAHKRAQAHKRALKRCQKLKGKARRKCVKRIKASSIPPPTKRRIAAEVRG